MPTAAKTQRWVDLIAALLANRGNVSFERLAKDVPGYLSDGSVADGRPSASAKRMFERDKKDLRAMGVPIETTGGEGDTDAGYSLRTTDFYLPYLSVTNADGVTAGPTHVDHYGYRSLSKLAFEPDELAVVEAAALRARELGDPALTAEADSAMRKLAFDLPVDPDARTARNGVDRVLSPRAAAHPEILEAIGDALLRRKRIRVAYNSLNSAQSGEREVEPYGLFFLNGHWYLAARDVESATVKNFRVSRIGEVTENGARERTPDYAIPPSFNLREHGRSRHAWELGDSDTSEAVVEFVGDSGATASGAELGTPNADDERLRTFRIRRPDVFVRWLLSFGGEAVPVAPPEIVQAYRDQVAATMKLYESDA